MVAMEGSRKKRAFSALYNSVNNIIMNALKNISLFNFRRRRIALLTSGVAWAVERGGWVRGLGGQGGGPAEPRRTFELIFRRMSIRYPYIKRGRTNLVAIFRKIASNGYKKRSWAPSVERRSSGLRRALFGCFKRGFHKERESHVTRDVQPFCCVSFPWPCLTPNRMLRAAAFPPAWLRAQSLSFT